MGVKGMAAVIATASLLALTPPAQGAAGLPDATFGDGGFSILGEPPFSGALASVVVLPDGKIVGGGSELSSGFLLARVNPNGSPDESFGPGGISVVPQEGLGTPRGINALVLQADGKIVAAGFGEGPGYDALEFARYLPGGSLDPEFGEGGLRMLALAPSGSALAVDLAPDEKIVATGENGLSGPAPVVRLTANGVRDEDFNASPAGVKFIDAPGVSGEQGFAVRVLADGAILIGGFTSEGALLAKLDVEGEPVAGFGSGGIAVHDLGSEPSPTGSITDLEVLPDGRIVATGKSEAAGGGSQLFVARFTAGGALDPSFAGGGVFRSDPTPELDEGNGIEVLPDGRLLVAGVHGYDDSGGSDVWLLRLTADGQLDPTFGNGGMFVSGRAGDDEAEDLALQSDGRAVIAGTTPGKLLFARFTADDPIVPISKAQGPTCRGRVATLIGTKKRDKITGTRKADVVVALGGHDLIFTGAGNDIVCAGSGIDLVKAGKGKDTILGEGGPDSLFGGRGRDLLLGGAGDDRLVGGGGPDLCKGGPKRRDTGGCEQLRGVP